MNRAAIYCRLSDEDRNKAKKTDESESIKNQKSLLCEYCENCGWQIQGIYCDEDMSGADSARPEFNRMIKACKEGEVDIVLCKTQSRFSRDMELVERYIHGKFLEWGVRFVGLLDHADTEDAGNKKSRQINGLVNEWYLEDLSQNVRRTLRHKKENGIYTGSFAPYGYRLDDKVKGKLFVDDTAAEVVKRIYSFYENGWGYVKIAKKLNEEGVPNPYRYKMESGSKFHTNTGAMNGSWNEATVRNILKNEVYTGTLVQGKTHTVSYKNKKRKKVPENDFIRIKNCHEAIIEYDRWAKIHELLKKRKRAQATGERHIFSGLIFCGECMSPMWKMSYKLKDGRYEYLKCKSTKCSQNCINKKSIRFDIVYRAMEKEIERLRQAFYDKSRIDTELLQKKLEAPEMNNKKTLKDRLLKQKLNIKQLYKDKLNGIIDNEIFFSVYKDISCEIEQLLKRLSETKDERIKEMPDFEKIPLDSFIVHKFIKKILIGKEENGKRKISIYFKI